MFQPSSCARAVLTQTGGITNVAVVPVRRSDLGDGDHTQRWVIASALVALTLKLVIAVNTFGTNDVISFFQFGSYLTQHGLQETYEKLVNFNHPPLIAYFLELIFRLSRQPVFEHNGITFPFLLRLPGIISDFITVLILLRVNHESQRKVPNWALHLFALSPVSLMVSGFHGNTDPIMVLFLVLAAYMALRDRPIACAMFFALSCQIKIIPLLFFPIFLCYWYSHRKHGAFFLSATAASLVFWGVPLVTFPVIFIKNVFSYGSFWGLWGITYWLRLTGWPQFGRVTFHDLYPAQNAVASLLKLLIIVAALLIAWRRRALPPESIFRSLAYAWIIFFVFSPGVGAQYMVWLAPFVLLLSPRLHVSLTLTSSVFLFFFYNTIADAFPWYIGISRGQHNERWLPWSIWPWAVLIIAMLTWWRNAVALSPQLSLFSLRQDIAE